jgi:hypothetical protein
VRNAAPQEDTLARSEASWPAVDQGSQLFSEFGVLDERFCDASGSLHAGMENSFLKRRGCTKPLISGTTMTIATTTTRKKITTMKKSGSKNEKGEASPGQLIDARVKELGDWRGETLANVRALIKQADPEVVEEVKWRKPSNPMGVPVWEHDGIICTGEMYKDKVKLTFAKGAALKDPSRLFNSSLDGNVRRAIDFHAGDRIDEKAFKALIRAAVALNRTKQAVARPVRSREKPKSA